MAAHQHSDADGVFLVEGQVSARTGIDQKGSTIIPLGSAGSMTAFMMQRGRQIRQCGDGGPWLKGSSMYGGEMGVAGKVQSLGVDCVPGEWTDADNELIRHRSAFTTSKKPSAFEKFVYGEKLYNYDNLPTLPSASSSCECRAGDEHGRRNRTLTATRLGHNRISSPRRC